jgi:hypothetical protein
MRLPHPSLSLLSLATFLLGACDHDFAIDVQYAECIQRSEAPFNAPQPQENDLDPIRDIYASLRVEELWAEGAHGRGRNIFVFDHEFNLPVNLDVAKLGLGFQWTGFHINKNPFCGALIPCKFVHEFDFMSFGAMEQTSTGTEYKHGTWLGQLAGGSDEGVDSCADVKTFAGVAPEATEHYVQIPPGFIVEGNVKGEGPGGILLQSLKHLASQVNLHGKILAIGFVAHHWDEGPSISDENRELALEAIQFGLDQGAAVVLSSKFFGVEESPVDPAVIDVLRQAMDAGAVLVGPWQQPQRHMYDPQTFPAGRELYGRLVRPDCFFDSNAVPVVSGVIADLWEKFPELANTDFADILNQASLVDQEPAPLDAMVAFELARSR